MNRQFIKVIGTGVISVAAVVGFITYCVTIPFPSGHTLQFLSPVMKPFLDLGESIYQSGARHAGFYAAAAACVGIVLSLMSAVRKENRRLSGVLILPAVTAAVAAELLYGHVPAVLSYFLLGAAFVLLMVASIAGLGDQLKNLLPSPTRRKRMMLLLSLLLLGFVFLSYHLDIKPPGHAHHSSEHGIVAAQLAHESPWNVTSIKELKTAFRKAGPVALDQAGIQIILDWIVFSFWGSHFILQRVVSVILGILSLYVLFLLAEELFGTWTAVCAVFIMAVDPWHNAHSRYSDISFVSSMLFSTLSVYCMVKALKLRSFGWTIALVLTLSIVFYLYPSTQFIVFVVIAFWIYSLFRFRQYWRSSLIVGLLSLTTIAILSAPKTHLLGPVKEIRLINSPINERADYSVQGYGVMGRNVINLVKSLLVQATNNDCWFRKEGAILIWPVSVLFIGGLAWCLPRFSDSRCALLILWFSIGVLPTIPSPDVLSRRITCAAPAIYILAALFAAIVFAQLRQVMMIRFVLVRRILVFVAIVVFSSSAFATFYYHTLVYEEWIHANHRRIAEIVYENIREYYLYLDYDPHEIIESVWVYCEKYLAPGEKDFPLTFFKESEFTQKILPALRAGPAGTMFLVPATGQGNALIEALRPLYPGGRYELYRLDREYFDHSKGAPFCQSYRIPREQVSGRVDLEVLQGRPEIKPESVAAGGPRAKMLEGKRGVGPGEYNEPRGIALDGQGNVYVADFRNYRIQKFDANGLFVTSWGAEGDYSGQFKDPCGVAVGRDGRVYVADTFNNRVQVFDGSGKYILRFEAGLSVPRGLAVDRKGRILVADTGNGVVKLFSRDGKLLKAIGKRGQGKGEFESPNSVAVDSAGKVYVADTGNRRVQILDAEGNYQIEFRVEGWEQGVFNEPYLDIDSRGDIYLTDPLRHRALRYSKDGKLIGVLKPEEAGKPLLSFPMGIAVEQDGKSLYIVDCRNHKIRNYLKTDFK